MEGRDSPRSLAPGVPAGTSDLPRSGWPGAFLPGLPSLGWEQRSPRALGLSARVHTGASRYLVTRGLFQHLRAQIRAELELPSSKIAPGQEQRLHLRAHGGLEQPAKDQGLARRGQREGHREQAASSSARQRVAAGPCRRGVRSAPENKKKNKTKHCEQNSAMECGQTGLKIMCTF